MSHPVIIRPVTPDDNAALRAIHQWAVENTTATMDTVPRTEAEQADWIDRHDGNPYPALVAEDAQDGTTLGYASLSPYIDRPGYRTTAEVSIYVHPDWHNLGIGRQLCQAILREGIRRGFANLVSLISADNLASLRLHASLGFTTIGTLEKAGRKFDRWVDVTFLQQLLPMASAPRDPATQGLGQSKESNLCA